jgi:biopolymer transport protein ExbD
MGGGGGSIESGEPEFQVAPMIDCLLVLLIFFMSITTAEVLQIDGDIELPAAPEAKKKESNKMYEEALNIKWLPERQKGVFSYKGKEYEPANMDVLVELLRQEKAKESRFRVIIRGDKRLPALEVQRAMNMLGTAGLDDIAFSALNQ